jgi:hypothetical protein
MSSLDQFESAFRSAAKEVFHHQPMVVRKILVITDKNEAETAAFTGAIRAFIGATLAEQAPSWREVIGPEYANIEELLEICEREQPDLICTYRHLKSDDWRYEHSLGEYLDVLSQTASAPVLALPHPDADRAADHALVNTDVVMAMTDHLTGSDLLVNAAVTFTQPGGRLCLTHVEDEHAFDRVLEVISKIPEIDTDVAREAIRAQLLKEPHDYVRSVKHVIERAGIAIEISELVVMGHHLSAYRKLVGDHAVDLLVMNTKDEDQLAMHGMAYPLAIELRHIPLLLL